MVHKTYRLKKGICKLLWDEWHSVEMFLFQKLFLRFGKAKTKCRCTSHCYVPNIIKISGCLFLRIIRNNEAGSYHGRFLISGKTSVGCTTYNQSTKLYFSNTFIHWSTSELACLHLQFKNYILIPHMRCRIKESRSQVCRRYVLSGYSSSKAIDLQLKHYYWNIRYKVVRGLLITLP